MHYQPEHASTQQKTCKNPCVYATLVTEKSEQNYASAPSWLEGEYQIVWRVRATGTVKQALFPAMGSKNSEQKRSEGRMSSNDTCRK
jgi:hypothetical protein